MKKKIQREKQYLFDKPQNVKRLFRCYYASLLLLLVLDLVLPKHVVLPWEGWPEFYAVFGFVACVALVLAAKYILRPLVKRKEDYYES
ncbi:MAG: hypothetical protein JRH08_02120 [Deltaproteobacteria bacterium]|nr:hypothetical protein [Deltaproteobacteria bacterium]MBW1929749.1 hypothetical protein [Deltaproteobacteria bacterium]MBW2024394.1 hypothetical protein [Deltaproteobacteria bacterium]MBW2124494.1 hypothetical protein [Deltaproteobacteria bacterium]